MCGRYQLTLSLEAVREMFDVHNDAAPFPPRYNIAPTQPIHVVRAVPGGRALALMRWGLLPSWVKDPSDFPLLINARAETAAGKPAFRSAVRRRRALVPATGFYEWRREGTKKVPYLFEADAPLAFAGIWETWCGPQGEEMETAAILTGAAEGVPARFHDRMPLTVPPERFADWLDPANEDGAAALELAGRDAYAARPVSRRLSNARNEGPGLMEPDGEEPPPQEPRDNGTSQDEDAPDADAPRLL